MAKLGEVCKLNMGQSPDSSSYNCIGDGIPFFQGNADFGEIHPNIRVWCNAPTKIAHPGEILISVRAPIGAMNIADCECCIGRGLASISADEAVCTTKYLWYGISSKIEELNAKGTGSTFKAINKKTLEEAEIPSRDLMEQERIAANLDRVTALISLRKQQITKLDELVKARFVEMFGDLAAPQCEYPELKLVDVCADADDIKCGPFGTQLNKDEYKTKGVAVWEIPQINSGFSEMPTHFITEEKAVILNAYSIEPGDIAMSRKGNVGKCGLFPENFKKGIIHSDVLRIRVDKRKVDSCFMMYQLHFSEAVKRQIEMVSSGAIMAGINVTKLKQIKVRIPELENQRMFAVFVERVDQQKQTVQQSLEKLELMKKALMQEYFG
ncbi:MAG: restriction endonuclease subunit S [Faecalibacterium sp.]